MLWTSNGPMAPSGYGQQTALFVRCLKMAGYDPVLFANYGVEGAPLRADGVLMLPRVANPYGNDILAAHVELARCDYVLSLYDPHALEPNVMRTLAWCSWTPIDCTPAHPSSLRVLREARWIWALSPHGQRVMVAGGIPAERITIVPHGIDIDVFKPGDKAAARRSLAMQTGSRIPEDAWLIVMNSANKGRPSRKGFYEAFRAIAVMMQRHPDVYAYCHAEYAGIYDGENLIEVLRLCGVDESRMVFPSQAHLVTGQLPAQYVANAYQAGDVFLHASYGEGFGIPIIEAQACGLPVVLADNTSQRDLCYAGWLTPCITFMPVSGMTWERPLVDAMVGNLESAYRAREDMALRARARAGAEQFDYRRVFEHIMLPQLQKIDAELEAEKGRGRVFIIDGTRKADDRPDVSVIMPVHRINTYPHARKAVDTALSQEGVRVQVVIVDHASDDDTWQTIQAWAAQDPRIVCVQAPAPAVVEQNGHLVDDDPRSLGSAMATGRYFVLGSSRAWYPAGAFRIMVDALDANPGIGFVYGATQYHGARTDLHIPPPFNAADFATSFPSLQGYMYRREAYDRGTRYRMAFNYTYPGDWDHVMQLIRVLGWKGKALDAVTYEYVYEHGTGSDKAQENPDVWALWRQTWGEAVPA